MIKQIMQKFKKRKYIILRYHSISNKKDPYAISPQIFLQQMRYLKKSKFPVLSIQEIMTKLKQGNPTKTMIAITFDDGFKDHLSVAAPILKRFGFPATFFINANTDKINKYERSFLNIKEILKLSKLGFEIGNHSHSHSILTQIPKNEAKKDIKKGKKYLEDIIHKKIYSFSFPGGAYNDRLIRFVKDTGHKYCIVGSALIKNEENSFYLIRSGARDMKKFKSIIHQNSHTEFLLNQTRRFISDCGRKLLKDKWF